MTPISLHVWSRQARRILADDFLLHNFGDLSLFAQWKTYCSGMIIYQICTVPPPCPDSYRTSTLYFVRICFSLPGEYRKLLAYALGVNFLSLGSWTKYS